MLQRWCGDKVRAKLDLAEQLGATHAVAAGPGVEQTLRKLSPLGYDVVIDVTGIPSVVEGMFAQVRPTGKLLFFGVCPNDATITVNPFDVYKKDLEIYGSFALCYTFHRPSPC